MRHVYVCRKQLSAYVTLTYRIWSSHGGYLASATFQPLRWKRNIPPNRRLVSNDLHSLCPTSLHSIDISERISSPASLASVSSRYVGALHFQLSVTLLIVREICYCKE